MRAARNQARFGLLTRGWWVSITNVPREIFVAFHHESRAVAHQEPRTKRRWIIDARMVGVQGTFVMNETEVSEFIDVSGHQVTPPRPCVVPGKLV